MVRNHEPLEPLVPLLLETFERVRKSLGSDDVREASLGWRMKGLHEESLEVGRESFVQPEVRPRRASDEVSKPRVRDLMSDDVDQGSISGEKGRGSEGKAGLEREDEEKRGELEGFRCFFDAILVLTFSIPPSAR